jgi:hypothetical protein
VRSFLAAVAALTVLTGSLPPLSARQTLDVRSDCSPFRAGAAALGALRSAWCQAVTEACVRLLRDPEPEVRRLAADGLALNAPHGDRAVHDALLHALDDPEPAVRRAVALAMGRVGADGAADVLVNTLVADSGRNASLRDGLVRAVERLGAPGIERLLARAESGVPKDLDRVVETFTVLRTRAAAEALPVLLKNPHLSIAQRAALLRSFANYRLDPPISKKPLLAYLRDHPEEPLAVKTAGLEALASGGLERDRPLVAEAIKALGEQPAGAVTVGELYLAHKLPHELRPQVSEALRRHAHSDPEAARLLKAVQAPPKSQD